MSSHQLAQYLFLLSGLPLPPSLPTPDGLCNCRTPLSICFWLPSTPLFQVGWAPWHSWKKGHVKASSLAFEIRQHQNDYAHLTSQKRGNIAVTSDGHLEITNVVDRHLRSDFIIDVKVCAMKTGDGDWKALWNADKTVSLCLRTIPLHRQRMKNSRSMRPIMLLLVLPFSFCSGLLWQYWLPGCEISVHFGFSGTSTV